MILYKIMSICGVTNLKKHCLPFLSEMIQLYDNKLELLQKICEKFKPYNTNKIVVQTHFEAPWFYAELYDKIVYK